MSEPNLSLAHDRREGEDRRQAERRYIEPEPPVPFWRANWKGVVGILAGVATLLTPVIDSVLRARQMEYQFRLDMRKAELEAQRDRAIERKDVRP